ncbi:MAG: bifunctional riboflavin kinase/FAD synthetase, partial [Gemmatimonadetes bacterium]|nr:bifunctional riboflavin kinase/FAD synthetase [Gemmatimonadota bacterium]
GRHYGMRAVVIRGDGRGRSIGFPTANLGGLPPDKALPPAGVYAVRGSVRTGTFDGALHLGPRPTFPGAVPSVELHLLDFDGNLYGEEVRVDFVDRLRDVRPFESVEALVQQLHRDVARAREILRRE